MTEKLYVWQQECLTAWKKNEYRGMVQAVTGAGKTKLAIAGIKLLHEKYRSRLRVKIVVPGKSLLLQWKHALEEALCVDSSKALSIGVCGGGRNTPTEQHYMVYVINSARYRLARQILHELKDGYTVLLIADECHHYASGENNKIFDFLPFAEKQPGKYCSLGLSATLEAAGYDNILVPALGKEIYHYNLNHALRNGTICDFAVWQIAISFQNKEQQEYEELTERMKHTRSELFVLCPGLKHCDNTQFFTYLGELSKDGNGKSARLARSYLQLSYHRKRIVYMANARTSCVCQLLKYLDQKKQVLIFGESIVQIDELYQKLDSIYPNRTGRYHSKMGTLANKNTLERFRNGNLRILLTCRALDEGINVPAAAVGIILSGTSMERQRMQRLGRLLRKSTGKRMACLYYIFVADSQEERAYFPKTQECFRAENLFFNDKTNDFIFPAYEKTADKILNRVIAQNLSDKLYQETLDCLRQGLLREDWLLPATECKSKVEEAENIHERNYWICMEQMALSANSANTSPRRWQALPSAPSVHPPDAPHQ